MMFLSEEEMKELTGKRSRAAQQQVLRFIGIEHRIRPDGSLIVLREHVSALLSGTSTVKKERKVEPNWAALG